MCIINKNPPSATKSTYMKQNIKIFKSNVSSHKMKGFHEIQYCYEIHAFARIQ